MDELYEKFASFVGIEITPQKPVIEEDYGWGPEVHKKSVEDPVEIASQANMKRLNDKVAALDVRIRLSERQVNDLHDKAKQAALMKQPGACKDFLNKKAAAADEMKKLMNQRAVFAKERKKREQLKDIKEDNEILNESTRQNQMLLQDVNPERIQNTLYDNRDVSREIDQTLDKIYKHYDTYGEEESSGDNAEVDDMYKDLLNEIQEEGQQKPSWAHKQEVSSNLIIHERASSDMPIRSQVGSYTINNGLNRSDRPVSDDMTDLPRVPTHKITTDGRKQLREKLNAF